ncbi:MAG: ABC transporter substrate-binding protein [Xanthobacteraceae bacterium]
MRRRAFIVGASAACVWPSIVRAQHAAPVIGFLNVASATGSAPRIQAFLQGLKETGFVAGSNVAIDTPDDPEAKLRIAALLDALEQTGWRDGGNLDILYRWGRANPAEYETLARELIAWWPDVILSNTTPVTAALQRQTNSIPIIFVIVSDPVGDGFVKSLSRPGGNITGFINFEDSMSGKWLELLKEAMPSLKRAGFVFNPNTAPGHGDYFSPAFQTAATALGIEPVVTRVHTPLDIEKVIADIAKEPGGGIVVSTDSFMTVNRQLVMSSADRLKVPATFPLGIFAKEGGLLAYGPDYHDLFRRSAIYIDRILRGANPAELPVQVPTRYELVINLVTARGLGLELPATLLARADEVIE